MKIEELESAVTQLSSEKLAEFSKWFEELWPISGIVRLKPIF